MCPPLGGGGCVFGVWEGDFYVLVLKKSMDITCLTQLGQKRELSEFWKEKAKKQKPFHL